MGHRLSKIYTRTGDDGTTGLGDGTRVRKDDPRVEAIGELDELNSALGALLAEPLPLEIRAALTDVQHDLFDLGAAFCTGNPSAIASTRAGELEQLLDRLNTDLPPLKEFILPGGSRTAALCHMARAICRRAERCLVAQRDTGLASSESLKYLNRLSDMLFVVARALNRHAGQSDVLWQPDRHRGA